jgi:hypothetical protein
MQHRCAPVPEGTTEIRQWSASSNVDTYGYRSSIDHLSHCPLPKLQLRDAALGNAPYCVSPNRPVSMTASPG